MDYLILHIRNVFDPFSLENRITGEILFAGKKKQFCSRVNCNSGAIKINVHNTIINYLEKHDNL